LRNHLKTARCNEVNLLGLPKTIDSFQNDANFKFDVKHFLLKKFLSVSVAGIASFSAMQLRKTIRKDRNQVDFKPIIAPSNTGRKHSNHTKGLFWKRFISHLISNSER